VDLLLSEGQGCRKGRDGAGEECRGKQTEGEEWRRREDKMVWEMGENRGEKTSVCIFKFFLEQPTPTT